jgi:protein-L-isoaspartate(D-aspartate) O-methyltransferase
MTAQDIKLLRIAMAAALVLALAWLVINRPWQRAPAGGTPEAGPTPAATGPAPTASAAAAATEDPALAEERRHMVDTQIRARGVSDAAVLAAMESVPRHLFVPDDVRGSAYGDHPLPIGYGQTISQPYIVAWMTELLQLKPGARVLEIGTGSGYQAAILAKVVAEVYSVEIVKPLATDAADRLGRLGYANVHVLHADGYYGWEEHAPYDAIVVTCAAEHIPQPLVQQLKEGGRLVLPIGQPGGYQTLWQVIRQGNQLKKRDVTGVLFVPLTGRHEDGGQTRAGE